MSLCVTRIAEVRDQPCSAPSTSSSCLDASPYHVFGSCPFVLTGAAAALSWLKIAWIRVPQLWGVSCGPVWVTGAFEEGEVEFELLDPPHPATASAPTVRARARAERLNLPDMS